MKDDEAIRNDLPATAPAAAAAAVPDTTAVSPAGDEPVRLKTFLLLCMLWLPLAVFIWFALRSVIAYPLTRLARVGLDWWLPGVIESTSQYVHYFKFTAMVPLPPGMIAEAGQVPVVDGTSNVLLFTYGLAVFWGLTLATPDKEEFSLARRLLTCLIGWLLLIPLQALSVVIDVAKTLFIDLGPAGLQMAKEHGVSLEVIAYLWQLTRLVAPTLSALVVWAIFHRRFIEHIRFDTPLDGEPTPAADGLSRTANEP